MKIEIKKPAVNKVWLFIISGFLWSAVGVMLNLIALLKWFPGFTGEWEFSIVFGGLVLGAVFAIFGFKNIVLKNNTRILAYKDQVCVFAFQAWKSYVLVLLMIALGIFMRNTTLVTNIVKAIIYITMGMTLLIASFYYFKQFWLYRKVSGYLSPNFSEK